MCVDEETKGDHFSSTQVEYIEKEILRNNWSVNKNVDRSQVELISIPSLFEKYKTKIKTAIFI